MRRWRQALGYAVALSITLGSGQAQEKPSATSETAAQSAYAEAKELRRRGEYQAEVDALSRACSAGAFEACHDLGVAWERGKVVPRDLGRAAELYRQACDHEVDLSCSNLGLMYEEGEGIKKDPKEAMRLYLKACDLRLPKACNNAAYLYQNGIGVPADPVAAVELFWRACRSNYSMSCYNLANFYFAGRGVEADLGRSLRLRVRACRGLYERACESLDDALLKLVGTTAQIFPLPQPVDKTEELDQRELEVRLALAAGDFDEAHRRLGQAMASLPDRDVASSKDVMHFVLLSSRIYGDQRQFNYARRALEDHLEIIDRSTAPAQNIYLVKLLVRLSEFDEQAKDMALARDHLSRALALEVALGVSESADLASGYNDLGRLCTALGDRRGALDAYNKAWAIADRVGSKKLAAASLNNVGTELMFVGEYRRAADNFAQALSMREEILNRDEPVIAQNLGNLSFAYGALGDWRQAVSYGWQQLDRYSKSIGPRVVRGESMLDSRFDKQLEREWLGILSWSITLDMLSNGHEGSRELAATAVATLRGFRTETLRAAISALRASPSGANSSLLVTFRQAQEALSSAYYVQPRDAGFWPNVLSNARLRLSDAEARIVEAAQAGNYQAALTNDAVRAAVPPHSALILYAVYGLFDPRAQTAAARLTGPHLAAYIFRRDRPTTFVNLGAVNRISDKRDSVLAKLRVPRAVGKVELLRELHQLVLEPVEPLVAGVDELIIVPGEEVAAVPFEALVDADGRYVIESRSVRYLSDAAELNEPARSERPQGAALSEAVIVAAPDYSSGPGLVLGSGGRLRFSPQAGAVVEGVTVAQHLGSSAPLSGHRATKSILHALHGPPVLHIASHGFFLRKGTLPAATADMVRIASGSLHTRPGMYTMEMSEPATIRSGIALSGANGDVASGTKGRAYDGILTAMEVAGLDLRNTQLAVLSACETGVGDPTFGEGLDGMRTALRIAGARTRLLSLWPVSDCATVQLMDKWYGRMVSGEDRVEALRRVKLDMLRRQLMPTSRRCLALAADWSDPYFWAPFVADGANGRL